MPCNISNCATCQTENACSQCLTSFQLVDNSTCLLCSIANCTLCNANGLCDTCVTGLTAFEGVCVQGCPANCATSSCSNFTGTCFACQAGFTLN